jgi:hypothetical protein
MRCDEVRMMLGEVKGGELSDPVRRHLDGCRECTAWWREWRLVSAGFQALAAEPVPEPSWGFATRVVRRLEEGAETGWGVADFWERAGRRVVWATLVLTLTAILALVVPSSGPVRGQSEPDYLLAAEPDVATMRSEPILDVDTQDVGVPATTPGVERKK